MKHKDYCSYKISMLGRQVIKGHILYERRDLIKKLWGTVIWFLIFAALAVFCFLEESLHLTPYSEYIVDFAALFLMAALLSIIFFIMLLRNGYRRFLGKYSDLAFYKRGGYKVDTIYVAATYRHRRVGFGTRALKTIMEVSKEYVNGTVRGSTVHAINLTGETVEGSYCPCISFDNGTIFVLPRTAVVAPKK